MKTFLVGLVAIIVFLAISLTAMAEQYTVAPSDISFTTVAKLPSSMDRVEPVPQGWLNLNAWQRPVGPLRVGVQVGHWKNEEAPEELKNLRKNNGAEHGGVTERAANLAIAEALIEELAPYGIEVDLLPVTVPPHYLADAVVAIHADGSTSARPSGYKIAAPWLDYTGRAKQLAEAIDETYGQETNMRRDKNITTRMRGYYAFNWRRYTHAIHPMTPAAIVETGFLTNKKDRQIIIDNPTVVARGIALGIVKFFEL